MFGLPSIFKLSAGDAFNHGHQGDHSGPSFAPPPGARFAKLKSWWRGQNVKKTFKRRVRALRNRTSTNNINKTAEAL